MGNIKELLKLNNRKVNNAVNKWATELNRHLTKEGIEMGNKQIEDVRHHMFSEGYKLKGRDTPTHLLGCPKSKQ